MQSSISPREETTRYTCIRKLKSCRNNALMKEDINNHDGQFMDRRTYLERSEQKLDKQSVM